jgi:CubicO group peptidase (beta-lactamase class C family)
LDTGRNLDNIENLFFEEPIIYEPGSHFMYNNAATYMLSKLISMKTGDCLSDFLRPRIFEPLGIKNVDWEKDVNGINYGLSGLFLSAHDLSKFGQLLLDDGMWNGRSLIPKQYIQEATTKQIDTSDFNEPFATADHRSGYGYQLWMNSYSGSYRLDGKYGQYVVIIPNQKAVVTYVSNEPQNMTGILELTWRYIVEQL